MLVLAQRKQLGCRREILNLRDDVAAAFFLRLVRLRSTDLFDYIFWESKSSHGQERILRGLWPLESCGVSKREARKFAKYPSHIYARAVNCALDSLYLRCSLKLSALFPWRRFLDQKNWQTGSTHAQAFPCYGSNGSIHARLCIGSQDLVIQHKSVG